MEFKPTGWQQWRGTPVGRTRHDLSATQTLLIRELHADKNLLQTPAANLATPQSLSRQSSNLFAVLPNNAISTTAHVIGPKNGTPERWHVEDKRSVIFDTSIAAEHICDIRLGANLSPACSWKVLLSYANTEGPVSTFRLVPPDPGFVVVPVLIARLHFVLLSDRLTCHSPAAGAGVGVTWHTWQVT
ncbi:hypothetical protein J6590_039170 [Homalodisca vitripennis]|nr:hypothetical protein J6590_039170 [Homalodisca vitripennis]